MPALDFEIGAETERMSDAVQRVSRALAQAGVDTPSRDARLLVAEAAGCDSARLIAEPERVLTQAERRHLKVLAKRRCAREPVSRILGHREFYGRNFDISPAVLDPRPDSETLIEMALGLVDEEGWRAQPIRILDVGTGSGCLLVSLLAELPSATGVGTDVSAEALEVAAQNAARHGVASRARFEVRRSLEGLEGPFELLVCNPPYIPTQEIAALASEVRDHDPRGALDGGADGLSVYREVIPELGQVVSSGWVLFEVGAGQSGAVAELLSPVSGAQAATKIRFGRDLGDHLRCVAAKIQV
jgi:release factor glutamine methyltransferase